MKNFVLILLCLILASCQYAEVQKYYEQEKIKVDTLKIEQIKIQTH